MKKIAFFLLIFMPYCFGFSSDFDFYDIDHKLPPSQNLIVPESTPENTHTYVRCWYRTSNTNNDPYTHYHWARDADGRYFKLEGYWDSAFSFKNMFYSKTTHDELMTICKNTVNAHYDKADITFFAADNHFSYNDTIWTNDKPNQKGINKIVSFGDSLSDTGNIFNASDWIFPNDHAWFLGHFSNGFVWTEYLAKAKNIPLYNWAIGGAAGKNEYIEIKGIHSQVKSYIKYMKMAENYNPENTLFTLEFGLNDFMTYDRRLPHVEDDMKRALEELVKSGAKNILVLTLPNATHAPQFKYKSKEKFNSVFSEINAFNTYTKKAVDAYNSQNLNMVIFDTYALLEKMIKEPSLHGFVNSSDACLDIHSDSPLEYLHDHTISQECQHYGSDKYIFWGVTHPTTAAHKYIAENILSTAFDKFIFEKK